MNTSALVGRLQKVLHRQNDGDTVDRIRQACAGMEIPAHSFIALASRDLKARQVPHLFSQEDKPQIVIDGVFRLLAPLEQPEPVERNKEESSVNLH
jgi:hypothetical protein